MTKMTKRYMVEAVDEVTRDMNECFTSRDLVTPVSEVSGVNVSVNIICKILKRMVEAGYVELVEYDRNKPYKYKRIVN